MEQNAIGIFDNKEKWQLNMQCVQVRQNNTKFAKLTESFRKDEFDSHVVPKKLVNIQTKTNWRIFKNTRSLVLTMLNKLNSQIFNIWWNLWRFSQKSVKHHTTCRREMSKFLAICGKPRGTCNHNWNLHKLCLHIVPINESGTCKIMQNRICIWISDRCSIICWWLLAENLDVHVPTNCVYIINPRPVQQIYNYGQR